MPHRYFTTEIADGTAVLRGTDAHHLARVMRARMGDTVILCDGSAVEYTATITGFGDDCVEFSVEPGYPSAAEPSVEVTLLAGYPKQDKLEQIIQHGVELGAAHVVPFFSRYCVAAPKKEEQKNERYNRIALEAAKQCGRGVLPDVALPLPNFGAVCRTPDVTTPASFPGPFPASKQRRPSPYTTPCWASLKREESLWNSVIIVPGSTRSTANW